MVNVTEEGDDGRTLSLFKSVFIFFEVSIDNRAYRIFGSFRGCAFINNEVNSVTFAKFFGSSITDAGIFKFSIGRAPLRRRYGYGKSGNHHNDIAFDRNRAVDAENPVVIFQYA